MIWSNSKSVIVNLFDGWIKKDYNIFEKENIKLKFNKQNECYKINDKYILPYPETLNDFISDLKRCNIDLYWKSEILKDLLVKDFYAENELKNYYNNLLRNLDKLNELI